MTLPDAASLASSTKHEAWLKRVTFQADRAEELMTEIVDDALDAPKPMANAVHRAADALTSGLYFTRTLQDDAAKYSRQKLEAGERDAIDGMLDALDGNALKAFRESAAAVDEAQELAVMPGMWWRRPLARVMRRPYEALLAREAKRRLGA